MPYYKRLDILCSSPRPAFVTTWGQELGSGSSSGQTSLEVVSSVVDPNEALEAPQSRIIDRRHTVIRATCSQPATSVGTSLSLFLCHTTSMFGSGKRLSEAARFVSANKHLAFAACSRSEPMGSAPQSGGSPVEGFGAGESSRVGIVLSAHYVGAAGRLDMLFAGTVERNVRSAVSCIEFQSS